VNVSAHPRIRSAAIVALSVVVADQVTKAAVQYAIPEHALIPLAPFLAFTFVWNTGAAFSLFANTPAWLRLPIFVGITAAAIGLLVSFVRRLPDDARAARLAVGLILGGAVGNLVCRLRYGRVVDFVYLHWGELYWPAFNVADSAITIGVAVVLLESVRGRAETEAA
jgi:signal peptidase II